MSKKMTGFCKKWVKHAVEIGHLPFETDNFEVIGTEYHNTHKRQISEAVLVKKTKTIIKHSREISSYETV